jgi:hypothetical protein
MNYLEMSEKTKNTTPCKDAKRDHYLKKNHIENLKSL